MQTHLGRPQKYLNTTDAQEALKLQKREWAKKNHKEKQQRFKLMSSAQIELIKYLKSNVIGNINLLNLIRERLKDWRIELKDEVLQIGK
jgi:hypothetical protein